MSIAPYSLILPPYTRFGRGEAVAAATDIAALGARILLIHGRGPERAAPLIEALGRARAVVTCLACPGEPTLEMLNTALEAGQAAAPDCVAAIGGGAALDLGKALAALLPVPGVNPLDHLEIVGRALPLNAPPLPFVAIPTTAGTGSEATRNAVIGVTEARRKVSLRDPRMMARLVVVDPSLTDLTPRSVTLAAGLDAVTQVIEPWLSTRAVPLTDGLVAAAIPEGLSALAALMGGEDEGARDRLAHVAYVSGMALANAGLGAVHGLAGVLGGETGAAHGVICGQLLGPVLRANRAALSPGHPAKERMDRVEAMMIAALGCGFDGLSDWARVNGLPQPTPLSAERVRHVAQEAAASSSMKPNPAMLSEEALIAILKDAGWG